MTAQGGTKGRKRKKERQRQKKRKKDKDNMRKEKKRSGILESTEHSLDDLRRVFLSVAFSPVTSASINRYYNH